MSETIPYWPRRKHILREETWLRATFAPGSHVVPFNEDPLLGFNEIAKRVRCVVTIRYPEGRTAQWVTEGLPERLGQLTCTNGENMTLKFYCPPGTPLVRFRRYRRGQ